MFSEFGTDEAILGARIPEGVHSIVPQNEIRGVSDVSINEQYRVKTLLADFPTEDADAIRRLYNIQ